MVDLVKLFDDMVRTLDVARMTDAEFAALVNFVDTMYDIIKTSGRVAKVSVSG